MIHCIRRVLVAAALATGLAVGPALATTLTDTLVLAYRDSNLLAQQRAVLRAADEDVAQAVAALRPTLNFIVQSDYSDPIQGIGMEHLTSQFAFSSQLTIWDGGRNRIAVEVAQESVLATRAGLVDIEQQVLLSAVQAHLNVVSSRELVQVRVQNVDVLEEQLQATRDRFEVGEVTRTDVSLAEAELASARGLLASAREQLDQAREAYYLAVGQYPEDLERPTVLPQTADSEDAAKTIAVRNHPLVDQAQHQVVVSDLNVDRAEALRRPSVTGTLQRSKDQSGNDDTSVGLEVTQPIYQGGSISSQVRQAQANEAESRGSLHRTVRQIQQQAGNAWATLSVSQIQIEASQQEVSASQMAFEGLQEEAELGAATVLDVLQAQQDVRDAQANLISARADRVVAVYSLLSSMGLLTVEHLDLGVQTYDPSAYYNAVRNAPVRSSVQGERLDRVLRSIGRAQ